MDSLHAVFKVVEWLLRATAEQHKIRIRPHM